MMPVTAYFCAIHYYLCLSTENVGVSAWNLLVKYKVFGSRERFLKFRSSFDTLLKRAKCKTPLWQVFCELGMAFGFRTVEGPGIPTAFNMKQEIASVVNNEMGSLDPAGCDYESEVRNMLSEAGAKYDSHYTFNDWFSSGVWRTGGSTMGRWKSTVVDQEGREKKLSLRKSMVVFTQDEKEVIDSIFEDRPYLFKGQRKQDRKDSSDRLFASSEMREYIRGAFIIEKSGKPYLNLPGNTHNETTNQTVNRHIRFLYNRYCKKYGIPFDYKGFDHQITKYQYLTILLVMGDIAVSKCRSEEDRLVTRKLADLHYKNSKDMLIEYKDDDNVFHRVQVNHSLLSGASMTAIVAAIHSKVHHRYVVKLLRSLNIDESLIGRLERWDKGDDVAIYTENPELALLYVQCLSAIRAVSVPGKLGVTAGQMEFLRLWFDNRVTGYACRALITFIQHAPWTSGPRTPQEDLVHDFNCLKTLYFRGFNVDKLWMHCKQDFSNRYRVKTNVITAPRHRGGLGLGRWDGIYPTLPYPAVKQNILNFSKVTPWASKLVENDAKKLNVVLAPDVIQEVAKSRGSSVIGTADIPSLAGYFRERERDNLKQYKPQFDKAVIPIIDFPFRNDSLVENVYQDNLNYYKSRTSYGKYSHLTSEIQLASEICAKSGTSLRSWAKENHLAFYLDTWSHGHVAENIAWNCGTFKPSNHMLPDSSLELFTFAAACAVQILPRRGKVRMDTMCNLASEYSTAFASTTLVWATLSY